MCTQWVTAVPLIPLLPKQQESTALAGQEMPRVSWAKVEEPSAMASMASRSPERELAANPATAWECGPLPVAPPAWSPFCGNVADVRAAVNFARQERLTVAVRGGSHNGAGLGVCDKGLVIDLSSMKGFRVDPATSTVRAESGCTQADLNHAAHSFGLAVPVGIISTTGIAGPTLGGGTGYLTRKFGLALDNLLEADVVLADGRFVTASAKENPDLFWALRSGGGRCSL